MGTQYECVNQSIHGIRPSLKDLVPRVRTRSVGWKDANAVGAMQPLGGMLLRISEMLVRGVEPLNGVDAREQVADIRW